MPNISPDTMLRYCQSMYDELAKNAIKNSDGHLWEGRITMTFSNLGISNSHYSKVMNTMYEVGSIEQVRRGARSVPSLIRLHKRPTEDDLARGLGLQDSPLTAATPHDKLSQRVSVLEGRLQGIEIAKWIQLTEQRITKLEASKGKR